MSASGNGDRRGPGNPRVPDLGPVPTVVVIGEAVGPAGRFVILQFHTPLGSSSFFLEPDQAVPIGIRLTEVGSKGRTGLILPTLIPPENLTGGPST